MIRPRLLLPLLLVATACGDAPEGDAPAPDSGEAPAPALDPLPALTAGALEIRDLAVAEPVTGERTAVFFTIHNGSQAGDALLGIEVDGVAHASVHVTVTQDGVMAMRPVDSVVVPPEADVPFRPGGLHGMLEGLDAVWSPGDTVHVLLRFRDAGEVRAPALVVPYGELDRRFPREPSSP